jgi:hypothetical protein
VWLARLWNARPERFARAPLPETIPEDLAPLLGMVARDYLPYLDANAQAFADGAARVRYEAGGARFDEPVKPYRVWCRDRLVHALGRLADAERAAVERALGAAALALLAEPSPRPAEDPVGALPIRPGARRQPVDSWWR